MSQRDGSGICFISKNVNNFIASSTIVNAAGASPHESISGIVTIDSKDDTIELGVYSSLNSAQGANEYLWQILRVL